MCGIAGIVAPGAQQYGERLARMVGTLRHRGPDGDGAHLFPSCALGHTRLSVIDVAGGAQPMVAPDGQTAVIFNGEIYGYKELRASLHGAYPFRTLSDTEVLLALYESRQKAMLDVLPGMFAFAIWDQRRQELFCARDRFGEKPLFYATAADGTFVFGSELKAVLASGLIQPVVDPDSLAHYLRYLYVHPHRTIYRNIHVLPPAHRLSYRNGQIDVAPYWILPAPQPGIGVEEAVQQFRDLLTRAVSKQLVADVPVGAFLSGGLDSSTIVALAASEHGRCRTFAFGFGSVIDELPFARGIAHLYGTDHVELSDDDARIADLLPRMAEVYDEPFGDSSNIPTFLLCEHARRHVTVALTGEGSDELLGGYAYWYRPLRDMEGAAGRHAMTSALARIIGGVCRRLGSAVPEWARHANAGNALRRQWGTLAAVHDQHASYFSPGEIASLLDRPPDAARSALTDNLDEILRADLTTYLPGDILVKADRASMAHGLELRAPFLDSEFASFCISLPVRLKVTKTEDKAILRRAFADTWTPEVRARAKQGFGAPVEHWLRRPDVAALTHDVLDDRHSAVYNLISFEASEGARTGNDYRTWALLVLALWADSTRAGRFTPGRGADAVAATMPAA
jgi:asparagine synthase (glutamine-hydrolysing)